MLPSTWLCSKLPWLLHLTATCRWNLEVAQECKAQSLWFIGVKAFSCDCCKSLATCSVSVDYVVKRFPRVRIMLCWAIGILAKAHKKSQNKKSQAVKLKFSFDVLTLSKKVFISTLNCNLLKGCENIWKYIWMNINEKKDWVAYVKMGKKTDRNPKPLSCYRLVQSQW